MQYKQFNFDSEKYIVNIYEFIYFAITGKQLSEIIM